MRTSSVMPAFALVLAAWIATDAAHAAPAQEPEHRSDWHWVDRGAKPGPSVRGTARMVRERNPVIHTYPSGGGWQRKPEECLPPADERGDLSSFDSGSSAAIHAPEGTAAARARGGWDAPLSQSQRYLLSGHAF